LLMEIAGRRLALWQRLSEAARTPIADKSAQAESTNAASQSWLSRFKAARQHRRTARVARFRTADKQKSTAATGAETTRQPTAQSDTDAGADPKELTSDKTTASVFEQARKQARRRFKN